MPPASKAAEISSGKARKILIIEDDILCREMLAELLTLEGYLPVCPAMTTSKDLHAEILAHNPDAILLDVHLKSMDGIQLLAQIRQLPHAQRPYLIMTSGLDKRDVALQNGADYFLLKPFMPPDLIDILKEIWASI